MEVEGAAASFVGPLKTGSRFDQAIIRGGRNGLELRVIVKMRPGAEQGLALVGGGALTST